MLQNVFANYSTAHLRRILDALTRCTGSTSLAYWLNTGHSGQGNQIFRQHLRSTHLPTKLSYRENFCHLFENFLSDGRLRFKLGKRSQTARTAGDRFVDLDSFAS